MRGKKKKFHIQNSVAFKTQMADGGRDVQTLMFEWTAGASHNWTKKNQIAILLGSCKKSKTSMEVNWEGKMFSVGSWCALGSDPKTQEKAQEAFPILQLPQACFLLLKQGFQADIEQGVLGICSQNIGLSPT